MSTIARYIVGRDGRLNKMATPQRAGAGTDLYATWVTIAFQKEVKQSIWGEWDIRQRPQELTYLSCTRHSGGLHNTLPKIEMSMELTSSILHLR